MNAKNLNEFKIDSLQVEILEETSDNVKLRVEVEIDRGSLDAKTLHRIIASLSVSKDEN